MNKPFRPVSRRERWRAFVHNRLWIGLPIAPLVIFVAVFLLRHLGDDLTVSEAAVKGLVAAGGGAFCYALGIWASTGETAPDEASKPRRWWNWLFVALIVSATLTLLCLPQIRGVVEGRMSVVYALSAAFVKVGSIAALVVPSLLSRNR